MVEIWQIFLGMFLLFFGLVSLAMGAFTTSFGAGKSRVIGALLLVLGIVVFILLYWLVAMEETIEGDLVGKSFLAVLAAAFGLAIAVLIVIAPMMLGSKETIDEIESLTDIESDSRLEEEKPEELLDGEPEGKPKPDTAPEEKTEPTPTTWEEELDPGVCIYCGSTEDIQKGHFMAPSKGGKMEVPACATCNASKGDKALMEWLRWVKENRPERWESFVAHNKGKRSELAQKIHKIRDEPDTAPEEPPKETPSTESPMTTHQEDDKFQKLGADLLKVMEKTTGTEGEEEHSKEGA